MNFDDKTNDGLVQEIDRICGSTYANHSYKTKASRINGALDRYLSLAFESDGRWSFDDLTETSPPIDTQNIVSGTNRYKFSAFTETILNLLKLEVLDSSGNGLELIPETMDTLGGGIVTSQTGRISGYTTGNFQELYLSPNSGTPTHYLKYGDFIYLRPSPNYNESDGLKVYFNRPASKFNYVSCTISQASPGVVTATAHGMSEDDIIILQTDGALPTGLSADTTYYLVATVAANTFSLSATKGGTAINTTSAGSGNHSYIQTNVAPGIPVTHHNYLARHASLPYLIEKNLNQMASIAQQIIADEQEIRQFFPNRDPDVRQGFSVRQQNNK